MIRHTLLVMLVFLLGTAGAVSAEPRKLVVVVAKGSSMTSMSRAELKRCFLGEPVTAGGKTLIPFNAPAGSPERAGFDAAVLGMSPDEVGRYWIDRKVRGQSPAPRSLPSTAHIVKVVAKFPGAIGYVPADQVTPDLQPVAVDGIAPSDPRYPIKTP